MKTPAKAMTIRARGLKPARMVEFMHSFEMLTKMTGDPKWSDRCEDVAFNSLPAALTPDLKGLHYLTCATRSPSTKTTTPRPSKTAARCSATALYKSYRCCQHNVSHGWPYFAEEMWLARLIADFAHRFTQKAWLRPKLVQALRFAWWRAPITRSAMR